MIGLKQLESAQRADDELLLRARETKRGLHEAIAWGLAADIAAVREDRPAALNFLERAIALGRAAGLTRVLANVYDRAAQIYREEADFDKAEGFADLAAASTQSSGDIWAVHKG